MSKTKPCRSLWKEASIPKKGVKRRRSKSSNSCFIDKSRKKSNIMSKTKPCRSLRKETSIPKKGVKRQRSKSSNSCFTDKSRKKSNIMSKTKPCRSLRNETSIPKKGVKRRRSKSSNSFIAKSRKKSKAKSRSTTKVFLKRGRAKTIDQGHCKQLKYKCDHCKKCVCDSGYYQCKLRPKRAMCKHLARVNNKLKQSKKHKALANLKRNERSRKPRSDVGQRKARRKGLMFHPSHLKRHGRIVRKCSPKKDHKKFL